MTETVRFESGPGLGDGAPPRDDYEGEQSPVTLDDFRAYSVTGGFIYMPTGDHWPARSVDSRVSPLPTSMQDKKGNTIYEPASRFLSRERAVEQMTWHPDEPQIITDRLITEGGWVWREGAQVFNQYRPPRRKPGDPAKAGPWREHAAFVYPEDVRHIERFLAHRIQRPGEKINHALFLGGAQGIGKDSLLDPVREGVGAWNMADVSPAQMQGRFNGFVKSVVLRISEARDLGGELDRFAFYEHCKTYTAAPPEVLRCDEKHVREYPVFNVCSVVITSNHKSGGIYLPADDRRHYIAWSPRTRDEFGSDYWRQLYRWYDDGGRWHVVAYLAGLDLADFDPKAPPPKTAAFFDIVDSNRAPEDAELADVLDALGHPQAVTLGELAERAGGPFAEWLRDRRNSRQIPHRLEAVGYTPVRNDSARDGLWVVGRKRSAIYVKAETTDTRSRIEAAARLVEAKR